MLCNEENCDKMLKQVSSVLADFIVIRILIRTCQAAHRRLGVIGVAGGLREEKDYKEEKD